MHFLATTSYTAQIKEHTKWNWSVHVACCVSRVRSHVGYVHRSLSVSIHAYSESICVYCKHSGQWKWREGVDSVQGRIGRINRAAPHIDSKQVTSDAAAAPTLLRPSLCLPKINLPPALSCMDGEPLLLFFARPSLLSMELDALRMIANIKEPSNDIWKCDVLSRRRLLCEWWI